MYTKIISVLVSASMLWAGMCAPASAAMISNQQVAAIETRSVRIAHIESELAREDVRSAMIELGVDPAQASNRVAALSDEELLQLETQLDSLPAGGSVLVLIGAVFVVLLILEAVGAIDIFKKA